MDVCFHFLKEVFTVGMALNVLWTGNLSVNCISISKSLTHPVSQSSFAKTSHSSLSICFTGCCCPSDRGRGPQAGPRAHHVALHLSVALVDQHCCLTPEALVCSG